MKFLLTEPFLTIAVLFFSVAVSTVFLLFYHFVFPKKKINPAILFLCIAILPIVSVFRPGTFESGDLRIHTNLLTSFYQNLQDGIFLPFWGGNICGLYGCPVFGIEYILPFYLGSVFHFFGFSFLTSIKLVLATSFVASGITMYFFAKEEVGKLAGFAAAIFYLFAPYHLIDIHYRGSIGEVLSFVFIPLIFLFAKKLIETSRWYFFFLESLSIVFLLMSHSSTTLVAVPVALVYGGLVWMRNKRKIVWNLVLLFGSVVYAVGLSAWYWLPALTEIKYTWQSLYTFGIFPNPVYYFYSPVGFGLLYQGNKAQIYPLIGYLHVILLAVGIYFLVKNKFDKLSRALFVFFLICFGVLFFMLLPISKPIWVAIPILHTFILIERLLVPGSFVTAMIAGIVLHQIKRKQVVVCICFIAIVITIPNWANRKMVPASKAPISDEHEFYTEYYEQNNPLYVKRYKTRLPIKEYIVYHPPLVPLQFIQGTGIVTQLKRTQELHSYVVYASTDVVIRDNTNYFPGWEVSANNKQIPINYTNYTDDSFGRITFNLSKGVYKIDVAFVDTPIRFIAKLSSALAVVGGIFFILCYLRVVKTNMVLTKKQKKS